MGVYGCMFGIILVYLFTSLLTNLFEFHSLLVYDQKSENVVEPISNYTLKCHLECDYLEHCLMTFTFQFDFQMIRIYWYEIFCSINDINVKLLLTVLSGAEVLIYSNNDKFYFIIVFCLNLSLSQLNFM